MREVGEKAICHPYIPATINSVERWLSVMAEAGWLVTHVKRWTFYFKRGKPAQNEYYYYSGFGASGALSYDFYCLRERSGRKNARISQNEMRIVEVARDRVDIQCEQFRKCRNIYYKNHYVGLLLVALILSVICIPAFSIQMKREYILIAIPLIGITIYAMLSLILISRDMKNR